MSKIYKDSKANVSNIHIFRSTVYLEYHIRKRRNNNVPSKIIPVSFYVREIHKMMPYDVDIAGKHRWRQNTVIKTSMLWNICLSTMTYIPS